MIPSHCAGPPEKADVLDAVETHRDSSGHAPIAGVGEVRARVILDERTAAVEVLVWSPMSGNTVAFLKGYAFFRCCGGLYFFPGSASAIRGSVEGSSAAGFQLLCCFAKDTVMWKDGSLEC